MSRRLGPEAARNFERRQREGFNEKYLSGSAILDIGFRGGDPQSEPITDKAIGIDLDYPGYDGKTLPFADGSQDAVFASHVLEHIEDWTGALIDWYRVLKVGGYLVVAVPHRDLYERKADLPSRFNPDHKRFYTPARLLAEIEDALPVGGYRVRSLRDIDDGFNYTVPPNDHAWGCYEIELVVEKIAIPTYAPELRPSSVADHVTAFFAAMVRDAVRAKRRGRTAEVASMQATLSALPIPSFMPLKRELQRLLGETELDAGLMKEIGAILEPILAASPFGEKQYLEAYPDVARAIERDRNLTAKAHFILHGYYEGRESWSDAGRAAGAPANR